MVTRNYTSFSLDPTLKLSEMTEHLRRDDDNPSEDLRGSQPSEIILNYPNFAINGGSAPRDNIYSPERQQDTQMSPRDRSPVRNLSPRQPSGKDPWNQWTTYTLTLLQLEQTTVSSGRRGTGPPTEPGFSQGFFSILSTLACLVGESSFPAKSST